MTTVIALLFNFEIKGFSVRQVEVDRKVYGVMDYSTRFLTTAGTKSKHIFTRVMMLFEYRLNLLSHTIMTYK